LAAELETFLRNAPFHMPIDPQSRNKRPAERAAENAREELMTSWLIGLALGLSVLVLFGLIERNSRVGSLEEAIGSPTQQVSPICRPQAGAAPLKTCR
jgi:hypothetical protein